MKVSGKLDEDLNAIVQAKWEQTIKETDAANLPIPIEMFSIIRVFFQLAYQEGQADTIAQLKQIYENDVDLFQEIFE